MPLLRKVPQGSCLGPLLFFVPIIRYSILCLAPSVFKVMGGIVILVYSYNIYSGISCINCINLYSISGVYKDEFIKHFSWFVLFTSFIVNFHSSFYWRVDRVYIKMVIAKTLLYITIVFNINYSEVAEIYLFL